MTAQEYAFLVVAVVGSLAAIAVVTARNVVHAALFLVVALASVGVTFLLVGAEFVGWTQILIYVGAIVILFLFGLMLTKAPIGRDTLDHEIPNRIVGGVVALLMFVGLASLHAAGVAGRHHGGLGSRSTGAPARSARRCSTTTCCPSRSSRSCCSRR